MYKAIKDSILWKDAEEQFALMPLREKLKRLSRVIYEGRDPETLTLEEQIDVLMKLPEPIVIIGEYLTKRQTDVMELVGEGMKYNDICKELGYQNRSSITQVMHSVRKRLLEILEDDDYLEIEIIKLVELNNSDRDTLG